MAHDELDGNGRGAERSIAEGHDDVRQSTSGDRPGDPGRDHPVLDGEPLVPTGGPEHHRADRRDWVLNLLGNSTESPDPSRYAWEPVKSNDPDVRPLPRRLLLAIAERQRWRRALDEAKRRAGLPDFAFPAA